MKLKACNFKIVAWFEGFGVCTEAKVAEDALNAAKIVLDEFYRDHPERSASIISVNPDPL